MFFRGVKIPKIESKPDPSRHRPGASGGYPVPVGPKGGLKSGYVASRMPSRRDPVTQPLRREPRPFRSTSHGLSSEKCHGLRSSAPAGIRLIPSTKIPDRECAATRFSVRDSPVSKNCCVESCRGGLREPSGAVGSQVGTVTKDRRESGRNGHQKPTGSDKNCREPSEPSGHREPGQPQPSYSSTNFACTPYSSRRVLNSSGSSSTCISAVPEALALRISTALSYITGMTLLFES